MGCHRDYPRNEYRLIRELCGGNCISRGEMKRSLDYPIPGCSPLPLCLYLSLFHFFGHACTFFLPRSGREKCRELFPPRGGGHSLFLVRVMPRNMPLLILRYNKSKNCFSPRFFSSPPSAFKSSFFFLFLIRVKSFNVRKGKSLSRLPKV